MLYLSDEINSFVYKPTCFKMFCVHLGLLDNFCTIHNILMHFFYLNEDLHKIHVHYSYSAHCSLIRAVHVRLVL